MQKSTVRRGAITGGVAGVAVLAALLAPAVANAAEPDAPQVTQSGTEVAQPGPQLDLGLDPGVYPADPSETVLVTKDRDGNVTVQRGQLPPGAVPAVPIGPGRPDVTIVRPGDQSGVTVAPRDSIPALPLLPTHPAPSTGSAG